MTDSVHATPAARLRGHVPPPHRRLGEGRRAGRVPGRRRPGQPVPGHAARQGPAQPLPHARIARLDTTRAGRAPRRPRRAPYADPEVARLKPTDERLDQRQHGGVRQDVLPQPERPQGTGRHRPLGRRQVRGGGGRRDRGARRPTPCGRSTSSGTCAPSSSIPSRLWPTTPLSSIPRSTPTATSCRATPSAGDSATSTRATSTRPGRTAPPWSRSAARYHRANHSVLDTRGCLAYWKNGQLVFWHQLLPGRPDPHVPLADARPAR